MNRGSQTSITSFEDLSNEIMYEIFEFLDFYHTYECFSNLNIRFDDLLNYFTLPIKLTILPMSKLIVQHCCTNIIIPYQDQINFLRLSNQFIFDLFSSPFDIISPMIRLETLILENIESKYLPNLLHDLASLPRLFSLVIIPIDDVQNKSNLYREIFRLPVLKYCKVTFNEYYSLQSLPMANNNELSPITNLIINGCLFMSEFNTLLSYVPQLHRLSCDNLSESVGYPMSIKPIALDNLTHVSLKLKHIQFYVIKLVIENLFSHIRVLHIFTDLDRAYGDVNQWKQMIIPSMPNLCSFNIEILPNYEFNRFSYHFSTCRFISLFLFEQQYCFKYEYQRSEKFSATSSSVQSNRRKHNKLHNWSHQDISPPVNQSSWDSINHICIRDNLEINSNLIYFPNVTKLILFNYSNPSHDSISTILERMISLKQLTTLIINYHNFCIGKLVELLYYSPNIVTLILNSISFLKISHASIQESQTFEIVSKKNKITNMTIEKSDNLENIKVFNKLCPRLQRLTIGMSSYNYDYHQSIANLLLSNDNNNTHDLISLCFTN